MNALRTFIRILPLVIISGACSAMLRETAQTGLAPSLEPDWDTVLQTVGDPKQCPHYARVRVARDARIKPWRLNDKTKLWEFVLVGSGEPPSSGEAGLATVKSTTGVILVLLPGGAVTLGAQSVDRSQPNFDPRSTSLEDTPHTVDIHPFYLAIHELTSGAAMRLFKDHAAHGEALEAPLTMVSWEEASSMLSALELRMPTDSEWEYAARGQEDRGWWSVQDDDYLGASLEMYGNIADTQFHSGFATTDPYDKYASDGCAGIAVPGRYRPWSYELYDLFGNAQEWCAGIYSADARPLSADEARRAAPGKICHATKGGSFQTVARDCRPTARQVWFPGGRGLDIGIRIAMSVRS